MKKKKAMRRRQKNIDMDSYRVEKQALQKLQLPDDEAVIDPVPVAGGGRKAEPELDRLSNILKSFNEQFGTLFEDADRVARRFREDIAPKVAADPAYQNAKLNTPHTARIEHDKALSKVMLELLKDDTEVYKQFVQNPSFKRFATDMVFGLTAGSATPTTGKRPRKCFELCQATRGNRRGSDNDGCVTTTSLGGSSLGCCRKP